MSSDSSARPPLPSAGWYPDGSGALRWWDGTKWTEAVHAPQPNRTWATLSHLSFFALAVVAPIVILFTEGRRDPFTKHHATEALNVQIWFFIGWNGLVGSLFVTAIVAGKDGPPVWMLAAIPLAMAAMLATAILAIRGSIQAYRGVWWRYPLPFRFVRGSVKKG